MIQFHKRLARYLIFIFLCLFQCIAFAGMTKGIYVTQSNLENTAFFNRLIERAKQAGITTFIIDLDIPSKRYAQNIQLLHKNNIAYVARITMFPDGGTPAQINNEQFWQRKIKLVDQAVNYGASQIQLDYIRYNTRSGSSKDRSGKIHNIINWYKEKLATRNIPLQVDVFGIASYGEEPHIGQNIHLFSKTVDVICPMVYPSHYEPFRYHATRPYQTVYESLTSLKKQIAKESQAKLIPYIELSNYRYPLSREKKLNYIKSQIKAAEDAGADGWYVWSPQNQYDNLFAVLEKNN